MTPIAISGQIGFDELAGCDKLAVARIPYAETRTYGEIAQQAGNPRAFRAAGTAAAATRSR